jgi:hypothetical protein
MARASPLDTDTEPGDPASGPGLTARRAGERLRPGRAYFGELTLDRYGHLYPESDAALRDRLDVIYSAGELDQGAALVELFREHLRPQRGHGTR